MTMGEIKTCFKTSGENCKQVDYNVSIPLETPIEELVYIIILNNTLPIYTEKGKF